MKELKELKIKNEEYRLVIEEGLKKALSECTAPSPLIDAMRYSIEAGGKRLRPCLALGTCEMLGGDMELALNLALGIEMIHTYSLIHDDLPCMDDDDMRRGRPSNHKVFGEAQALLAGDALLSYAFEWMMRGGVKANSACYYKGLLEIAIRAGAGGMVAGQSKDLEAENNKDAGEETLNYIHRHKTADMLAASVLAGAYCADADEKSIAALSEYSDKMGLLFQLTDDILDAEGDEKLVGKTLGKDEKSHKLTFVSLYGIEEAKRISKDLVKEGKAILEKAFASNAKYLSDTLDYIAERNS